MGKVAAFDPERPDSRPTAAQQAVLDALGSVPHRYVRAANQGGKTTLACREASWILTETHPTWSRPAEWGSEPLFLICVGRTTKQVEETIWRRLQSFLEPSTYRVQRTAGVLQKVTHLPTGNTLIFVSHHNVNEAREKLQSYVAHWAWIDEMPADPVILEEMHRRVMARSGHFLATFTPKVVSPRVRSFIDAADPSIARTFPLAMLDNPVYTGRHDEILASLNGLSEAYRRTVLFGDWMIGENQVFHLDPEHHIRPLPRHYSPRAWRHVLAVDPALKSKLGLVLLAEDPSRRTSAGDAEWYVVRAQYIEGIPSPSRMVAEVELLMSPYFVSRRIYDTEAAWYAGAAYDMGVRPGYVPVREKAGRKNEMIAELRESLGVRLFLTPDLPPEIFEEFANCQWAEGEGSRIVHHSRFHVLDALQYAIDGVPPPLPAAAITDASWENSLYRANESRIRREATSAKKATARWRVRDARSAWSGSAPRGVTRSTRGVIQ